jgi:large-conductance mechanosensitive channel
MVGDYMEFISKFNVLGLAIGLMIGSNLKDVASDFIDDVLMPFVNPILKKIINEKNGGLILYIPSTSIKLHLERVVSSAIKFLCLSIIIFGLLKFGVQLKKPVQWVSVRNFKEMRNVLKKK